MSVWTSSDREPSPKRRPGAVVPSFRVKANLDAVVLAYLAQEPRTGRELMKEIERDLQVRLSPGTIYPLLRKLEKEELLTAMRGMKEVVYRPANRARVQESIATCLRLAEFLKDLCENPKT